MTIAISIYAIDRLIRVWRGLGAITPKVAEKLPGGACRLRFAQKTSTPYRCGQYVLLRIPVISRHEWHPFTLSSAPNEDTCEVTVKRCGDYTAKLCEYIEKDDALGSGKPSSLRIHVDGPYGHLKMQPNRYENVVLIGGGIGVTPLMSILKHIFGTNTSQANAGCVKNVYLLWSIPSHNELQWFLNDLHIAYENIMNANIEHGLSMHSSQPTLSCRIFFTRPRNDVHESVKPFHQGIDVCVGRPDFDEEMRYIVNRCRGYVSTHTNQLDVNDNNNNSRSVCIGVYVCGPRKLANKAWKSANRYNHGKIRVDIDVMTF